MGALDRVDAVDLHEAEPPDQREEVVVLRRARGWLDQRVAVEEEAPRLGIGECRQAHPPQVRSKSASQFLCASLASSASS